MNNDLESPLWHGEIYCIKKFYELPKELRPNTADCIFLSSHEPCSLCLSAITWCGFDNFYYLFGHNVTRDSFEMPLDLKILKEVFNCESGAYNKKNAYWTSYSIKDMVVGMNNGFCEQIERITERYNTLYRIMQEKEAYKAIPIYKE